ncbi:hypothetical protein, partial [Sphingomonas sp. IW22]|uniref:hypothetical protein n=1 Tax=Sphingomonas sp. IW22 TaxID=3242489 RepID=UPI00351FD2D8
HFIIKGVKILPTSKNYVFDSSDLDKRRRQPVPCAMSRPYPESRAIMNTRHLTPSKFIDAITLAMVVVNQSCFSDTERVKVDK